MSTIERYLYRSYLHTLSIFLIIYLSIDDISKPELIKSGLLRVLIALLHAIDQSVLNTYMQRLNENEKARKISRNLSREDRIRSPDGRNDSPEEKAAWFDLIEAGNGRTVSKTKVKFETEKSISSEGIHLLYC